MAVRGHVCSPLQLPFATCVRENSTVFSAEFTTLLPWQQAYLPSLTLFFFLGGVIVFYAARMFEPCSRRRDVDVKWLA